MDRTYLKTLIVDFIAQQREASTCAVVAHLEAHGAHLPWAAVREILDDFEINDVDPRDVEIMSIEEL